MEIERKGGNCVIITSPNKESIVVDPKVSQFGLKDQGTRARVHLLTDTELGVKVNQDVLTIDGPGEYEISEISIKGTAVQGHSEAKGQHSGTAYRLESSDINIAIIGNISPDLSEATLETLGVIDVLILPVGGGDTLTHSEAVKVTRKIDPKVVIPVHYEEEGVKSGVQQDGVDLFINELGAPHERLNRLKLKSSTLAEALVVYELIRS